MVGKKITVLIVDDERVVCDLLYDGLHEQGYRCVVAFNGNDALTELSMQHFDLVLLDIKLPGISGMELLRNIRANHRNIATIMVTAVNDVDTAVETMRLGASDYIVKPFDLDRVNTSVRMALAAKTHLPKRRDYEVSLCGGDLKEDEQSLEKYFNQMNAIARGVEARLDLLFSHSKRVVQETIDIARQLDIPEEVIQRWADIIARHDSKRNAAIKSSLNKLERHPLAQRITGITQLHLYRPKPREHDN